MKLHTSRYQNGEVIAASGLVPLGHTRGYPRFALPYPLAANVRALAPRQMSGDWRAAYRAQLDELGFEAVKDAIVDASKGGGDVVLLCYEHIGIEGEDSCHRRVLAAWWEEQTGDPVVELEDRGSLSQKLQALARRSRPAASLFG